MDSNLTIALNGHSEEWTYNSTLSSSVMVRSGDAGFYQWAAFQFPIGDLNTVGTDNEFTLAVSGGTYGVLYDALRMEITNTSANPSVTGWDDYNYINGSTQIVQDDADALAAQNAFLPEPASASLLCVGAALLLRRRPRHRLRT
jgi:hypothetical protein